MSERPSADDLRIAAVANPECIDRDDLYAALSDHPLAPDAQAKLVIALANVARVQDVGERFIEPIVVALERKPVATDALGLRTLREIGRDHPEAVLEHVDTIVQYVDGDDESTIAAALDCLIELADSAPTPTFLDLVPRLSALLDRDDVSIRRRAVFLVAAIAKDHPSAVKPVVPQLLDGVDDADEQYRTNALSALGRVTSAYPSTTVAHVEALGDVVASTEGKICGNALGLLADVATAHPEQSATQLPVVIDRLDSHDEIVRGNASSVLVPLAATGEDGTEDAIPQLLELLDDPSPVVRRNACKALGHLGPSIAVEHLRRQRENDPDAEVRNLAGWALERCS